MSFRRMIRERFTLFLFSLLGTVVMTLALGGWGAHAFVSTLATKDQVIVLAGKADYIIDRQIEAVVGQIAHLERKPNKTPGELEQLRYLRGQLAQLRRVRDGK